MASFEREVPIAEHVGAASVATAMQALNAIPAVCTAARGIASMADLPLIRSIVGFGNASVATRKQSAGGAGFGLA